MVEISHFVRPNGEMYRIVKVITDDVNSSILIELENGTARWFRYNEIVIEPPFIKMMT